MVVVTACSSTTSTSPPRYRTGVQLPDKIAFMQTDRRWSKYTLGGSGERLSATGCLVTAVAMALRNLDFQTDPGDLSKKLKAYGGFNKSGLLVWAGVERATSGRAKAYFYKNGDANTARACLAAKAYPLVKFTLPNRSAHWVVVLGEQKNDFLVRDPTVKSRAPILLSSRTKRIEAVRCIGLQPRANPPRS